MMHRRIRTILAAALVAAAGFTIPAVHAAPVSNTGTGDIAGVPGDLTPSNTFTLDTAALALVKRAFLANGTPLADNASVPRGTLVKFLLYINNNTGVTVNDVSVRDVLNATGFAYQAGTIKTNNTATCVAAGCTVPEEAAIYAAVDGGTAKTDGTPDDEASYTGASTTIDIGNQNVGTNSQLNILPNAVWSVIFTVRML